jgi:hypothetical protein
MQKSPLKRDVNSNKAVPIQVHLRSFSLRKICPAVPLERTPSPQALGLYIEPLNQGRMNHDPSQVSILLLVGAVAVRGLDLATLPQGSLQPMSLLHNTEADGG